MHQDTPDPSRDFSGHGRRIYQYVYLHLTLWSELVLLLSISLFAVSLLLRWFLYSFREYLQSCWRMGIRHPFQTMPLCTGWTVIFLVPMSHSDNNLYSLRRRQLAWECKKISINALNLRAPLELEYHLIYCASEIPYNGSFIVIACPCNVRKVEMNPQTHSSEYATGRVFSSLAFGESRQAQPENGKIKNW